MIDRIKEIYSFGKKNYNKERFIYFYVGLPALMGFALLCLLVISILLLSNTQKYIVASIIIFACVILVSLAYWFANIYISKCDVKTECQKIKAFFEQSLMENPTTKYILPKANLGGTIPLTFEKDGININGELIKYDLFECGVYTTNINYCVKIVLLFSKLNNEAFNVETNNEEQPQKQEFQRFSLPLDINLLSLVEKYNITISNPDVLNFIREFPEKATKQILKYGKIQKHSYKTR